jgi:hypothetical protein
MEQVEPHSRGGTTMSRRARIWLLAVLTAATTSVAMVLATAAQAGIQGSGH